MMRFAARSVPIASRLFVCPARRVNCLRHYSQQIYSPFVSFTLPSSFSPVKSQVVSLLDADYETPHPGNTVGTRKFAKHAHWCASQSERLFDPEEVEAVLLDYLREFVEQNPKEFASDLIAVMPCSKGPGKSSMQIIASSLNEYLGNKSDVAEVLVRKAPMAVKTTNLEITARKQPGAAAVIQFPTLVLNKEFEKQLKGASVLVLDDTLVYGNISEAARNLLIHAGISRFTLLTMVNLGLRYFAQKLAIAGDADVFSGVGPTQWKVDSSRWIMKPKSQDSLKSLAIFLERYPQYSV